MLLINIYMPLKTSEIEIDLTLYPLIILKIFEKTVANICG